MKFRSIAVEGPIGVGKTSFVELLARKFDAYKVLEDVENPFLKQFYEDAQGAAFQAQLFFLLSRYRQLQELAQRDLFHQVTLCDYIFPKDKIFAYLNLDDSELLIYDKLYAMLEPQVPPADLVLYLEADVDTCMGRIRRRQRTFERHIAREYLVELIDAYNHFYHHYRRSPVLVVDTRRLNFPQRPGDFEELVEQLRKPIKGTQYFSPLGTR